MGRNAEPDLDLSRGHIPVLAALGIMAGLVLVLYNNLLERVAAVAEASNERHGQQQAYIELVDETAKERAQRNREFTERVNERVNQYINNGNQ